MRDDELQVLGNPQGQDRWKKWHIILAALFGVMLIVILGIFLHTKFSQNKEKLGDTTIVPELQNAVDSLLNAKLEEIDGLQGQVIVMEVNTGRILAMAGRERRYDGKFQPCRNFDYQQEPGQTKITAVLLTLLETGEVSLDDEVDVGEGVWDVDELQMLDHNWSRGGYGKITLERALEVSSNIGISKAVQKVFKGKELKY